VLPFDSEAAAHAAEIRSDLERAPVLFIPRNLSPQEGGDLSRSRRSFEYGKVAFGLVRSGHRKLAGGLAEPLS
jgi:hypothetical protein